MINEIIILDCTLYRDALIHLRCYLTFKLVLIMRYKYSYVYEMIIGDKYKKCGIWSFIMCKSITNDRYQFKKVIIKLCNYKVSMFFEIYLRVFLSILFFFIAYELLLNFNLTWLFKHVLGCYKQMIVTIVASCQDEDRWHKIKNSLTTIT